MKKQKTKIEKENEINPLLQDFIDFNQENDSYNEILNDLLDSEHNLELKTHIFNPLYMTFMTAYRKSMKNQGLLKPNSTVKKILKYYRKDMISYKRLGRTEILNAITVHEIENESIDLSDKLIRNAKKL